MRLTEFETNSNCISQLPFKHLVLSEQLLLLFKLLRKKKQKNIDFNINLCHALNVQAQHKKDRRQKVVIPAKSQKNLNRA